MPRHLRSRTLLRAAVVVGATIATAAVAGAQGSERHALRGAAAVWNLVGTVRVVAGSGSDVTVDVVRRGRDASKLRVEAADFRGASAVRVIYPDDDIVYPDLPRGSRMRTRVRSDGTWGGGNYGAFGSGDTQIRGSGSGTEAWADVTVAVPSGRKVAVHLAAGEATVTNVDGDLDLDVDAASVTVDGTRGRLAVDAGSGRVRVSNAQGDVDLDLGSGPVDLRDVSATRLIDGGSGGVRILKH